MITDSRIQDLRNDGYDDAADELERLRTALDECRYKAHSQRIWNGTGWTYTQPIFKQIFEIADTALKPNA
jgi:hypothetical protein